MRYQGQLDYTASPPVLYARPSGAATFVMSPVDVAPTTPSQSDPGTGAIGKRRFVFMQSTKTQNFTFAIGLLLLTMWLESGRKGGIL